MKSKKKCVVLFSGGLDSRLAIKIMQKQGMEVIALFFKFPFSKDVEKEIKTFSKKEKIKLKIFDCTKGKLLCEYLNIIRKPKYGKGAGINPCIDCRIFILKKTKEFADKNRIDLVVTGEVLGERPMSQMKRAMNLIEEKSRLKGRILRPLSAKLLPDIKKKELIDKESLYDISGRGRQKQIALAKKFKISYPSPGGGCLLCEKLYCEKLKKILDKNINYKDIQLLKTGRHFKESQIILGRNKEENKLLEKEKGIKIIPQQPGPTALIKKKKYEKEAKKLIQKYSKKKIKDFRVKE